MDFVQWGSAGNGREDVAVAKGIWIAGTFVSGDEPFTYTGNGGQNGSDFWEATTPPPPPPPAGPNVRIFRVDPANNTYHFKNFGDQMKDISSYQLCSESIYTANLSSLSLDSGALSLAPDGVVKLSGFSIDATGADFSLYEPTSNFGDINKIVDFVQWGNPGNDRESLAVQKGIWATGDFLSGSGPFQYIGDGDQNGVQFWQ